MQSIVLTEPGATVVTPAEITSCKVPSCYPLAFILSYATRSHLMLCHAMLVFALVSSCLAALQSIVLEDPSATVVTPAEITSCKLPSWYMHASILILHVSYSAVLGESSAAVVTSAQITSCKLPFWYMHASILILHDLCKPCYIHTKLCRSMSSHAVLSYALRWLPYYTICMVILPESYSAMLHHGIIHHAMFCHAAAWFALLCFALLR